MTRPFPGLGAALLLLGGAFAAQVAASALLTLIWHPELTLLAGTANLIALLGVAAFGYWRSGERPALRSVPEAGVAFWAGLALAAAGATVVLGELANLTTLAVPLSPELSRFFNGLTGDSLVSSLFTLALVAPLTEEALFRGLLLRGFARRWGPGPALVLSSALFGLFHLNVWQAPTAFVAGLFLGWLYLRTGSLLYPMAVHALFNGLPILLEAGGFVVAGYNTPAVAGVAEFQPPLWVAAGTLVLVLGLWMTRRWAPLSPTPVSDTVEG